MSGAVGQEPGPLFVQSPVQSRLPSVMSGGRGENCEQEKLALFL